MPSPFALEVDGVNHAFGRDPVLKEISFNLGRGSILCVLGPSGCGKTTLLRIIAGLVKPHQGHVRIDGLDQAATPTHRRDIGYVFQDLALFPHLNVRDNIAFPFLHGGRDVPRGEKVSKVVNEILNFSDLESIGHRGIANLSGGQLQRVALARALVYRPSILLLDEPLSSLDNLRKGHLLDLLLGLQEKFGTTLVYVTHDEGEARLIGTHVMVIEEDHALGQFGPTTEVIAKPSSPTVAHLIGGWNVLAGRYNDGPPRVELAPGVTIPVPAGTSIKTPDCSIGLPMQSLTPLRGRPAPAGAVTLPVVVHRSVPWLNGWRYQCRLGSGPIHVVCFDGQVPSLPPGESAVLSIAGEDIYVFPS
jgi:ABC-type Fe3+/spermidine/putrescine transport system ATPase subunit